MTPAGQGATGLGENDDPNCSTCDGWEGNHEVHCPRHPSAVEERREAERAGLLARVARLERVVDRVASKPCDMLGGIVCTMRPPQAARECLSCAARLALAGGKDGAS